jgi:CHAD domain-containing protein
MPTLKKFAHRQFQSLTGHLKNFKSKKETDLLHKIRVDIKKIKSILLLTDDRIKGFKAHSNYIPFRVIFRRAAEIREPEVLSGLLLRYNIVAVRDSKGEGNSDKQVSKFCKDVPLFIKTVNRQWSKLTPSFSKLKANDLKKYLRKIKKNIKANLHPKPDMNSIHRIRKSIKTFIYLSEAHRGSKKKLKEFYSKEIEAIGKLHDRQVLLKMMTQQNGSADTLQIKKIRREVNTQKNEIRNAALTFYGRN